MGKKVKWTEQHIPRDFELDWYPETNWSDYDKHYEGEIIGTTKGLFGSTYLVVACTDNIIREVEISRATIIE